MKEKKIEAIEPNKSFRLKSAENNNVDPTG